MVKFTIELEHFSFQVRQHFGKTFPKNRYLSFESYDKKQKQRIISNYFDLTSLIIDRPLRKDLKGYGFFVGILSEQDALKLFDEELITSKDNIPQPRYQCDTKNNFNLLCYSDGYSPKDIKNLPKILARGRIGSTGNKFGEWKYFISVSVNRLHLVKMEKFNMKGQPYGGTWKTTAYVLDNKIFRNRTIIQKWSKGKLESITYEGNVPQPTVPKENIVNKRLLEVSSNQYT